jgi:hypothetical protein
VKTGKYTPRAFCSVVFSLLNINQLSIAEMDSISTQVEALAAQADEAGRVKLLLALRDLQLRVETQKDTFMRFYNSVGLSFVFCKPTP